MFPNYLTKEEAIEDFLFLCATIRESDPYLGVANRKYGIDFDKHQEKFLNELENEQDLVPLFKHYC